jgi:hypothetical protein
MGRKLVMPCFRALAVELNGASLSLKGARQYILTVSTSSLPSEWIQIAVTIRDVTSNSTNYAHSIFPSTFTISRELADHYPRTVSFFPPVAGTFTIEVVITGPSQHEFVVKYPTGKVLQVLGVGEEPPLPHILSADFANGGAAAIIRFSSPTDRAAVFVGTDFPCSQVLSFRQANSVRCAWTDASTIRMFATTASGLALGSEVTLLGNILKNKWPSPGDTE